MTQAGGQSTAVASATASVTRKAQSMMQHIRADQRAAVMLARESVNSFMRIDAMGLAKQVAFSVLFAALPAIFVLVSAAALMEHYFDFPVTSELRTFIVEQTPPEAHIILLAGVDRAIADASTQLASFTALFAILLALWGGMAGVGALIEATNRAYGIRNTRNMLKKRAMSLGLTLLFTAMVVLTVAGSFFSGRIVKQLVEWGGSEAWLTDFGTFSQLAFSIAITFAVLFILYFVGPDVRLTARMTIPGAVIGTMSWVLLIQLFGVIASRVPYANIYGAAGTAIILLYFLNFAALGLILGAIVNGAIGHHYDKLRAADLAAHPEKLRYIEEYREQYSDTF
jgi:membrane protein